jgi:nitrite reductase/ring-hydroxylating ferredoxin subunit
MIADAGRPEDYADGAVRIIEAGGRQVGVIRWGDDFYAVRNVCPHESGPVCAGLVRPGIVAGGRPSTRTCRSWPARGMAGSSTSGPAS